MQKSTFIGYDGKEYSLDEPREGGFEVRNDGRFWHISFPIAGDPGGKQVYRGRELPGLADHDRWVQYRPYPPGLKRPPDKTAPKT